MGELEPKLGGLSTGDDTELLVLLLLALPIELGVLLFPEREELFLGLFEGVVVLMARDFGPVGLLGEGSVI